MCLHPNTIIENAICNIVADITLKELPSSNKHLPDSPFITLFTVKRYCQHSGKATMRDYERSLQEQVDQMTSFWHKASQTTNQPTPLAVFFSSLHLVWNQVQKQIRIKPIQCSLFSLMPAGSTLSDFQGLQCFVFFAVEILSWALTDLFSSEMRSLPKMNFSLVAGRRRVKQTVRCRPDMQVTHLHRYNANSFDGLYVISVLEVCFWLKVNIRKILLLF